MGVPQRFRRTSPTPTIRCSELWGHRKVTPHFLEPQVRLALAVRKTSGSDFAVPAPQGSGLAVPAPQGSELAVQENPGPDFAGPAAQGYACVALPMC